MAKSKAIKTRTTKKRSRRGPAQPHPVGIRLTQAMKDALDEVAFEWQTTRATVMRALIAHALKSPPKRKR